MGSPGQRAEPRHRAPSAAARVRAYAARIRGRTGRGRHGADDVLTGLDDARPRRNRSSSRGRRISPALRRLVVTPTFAAGLGVVVAAFLAANMSRTVLHFSAPIPGNQCSAGDCHAQPHGGTLASARPGVRITPRAPAASGPVTAVQPGGSQPGGGQSGVNKAGGSQSGGSQSGANQSGASQSGANQSGVNQQGGTAPAAGGSGGPQPSVGGQASQHHLPAGRAVAGRLFRPDHDPRAQRDQDPGLEPGLRLPRGADRRCPGRTLGAGPGGGRGGAGRGVVRLGAGAPVRGPGTADGHRGGPARRTVRLRLRRAALRVRCAARPRDQGRTPGAHGRVIRPGRSAPRSPVLRVGWSSSRRGQVGARFSLGKTRRVTGFRRPGAGGPPGLQRASG